MSSDEQLDRLEALLAEINASEPESDEEEESQLTPEFSPKRSGVELTKSKLSEPSQSLEVSTDKGVQENESNLNLENKSEEAKKENGSKPIISFVRDSSEHTETEIKKEEVPVKRHQETKNEIPVVKDATSDVDKSVESSDSKSTGFVRDSSEHAETEIKKEEVPVKRHQETKNEIPVVKDATPDLDKSVESSDSKPTGFVRDSSEHTGSEIKKEEVPVKRHQDIKNGIPVIKDAASDVDKSVESSDSRPTSFVRDSSENAETEIKKEDVPAKIHQEIKNEIPVVKDAASDVDKIVESSDSRPTGSVRDSSEHTGTDAKKDEVSINLHQEPNTEVLPIKDAASDVGNSVGSSPVNGSQEKSDPGDKTPTLDSTSRSTAAEKKKQKKARQKQKAKAAKAAGLSPSPILGSDSPLMSLDSPKIASGSPSLSSIPQGISAESSNLASQSPGSTSSASVPITSKLGTSLKSGEPQNAPGVQTSEASSSTDKFEIGEAKKDVTASIDSTREDTLSSKTEKGLTEPESNNEKCEHLVEEKPRSSPHERKASRDAENEIECEPSKSEGSDLNNLQQANQGPDVNHSNLEEEKILASSENPETDSSGGTPNAVSSIPDSLGISLPTTPNKLLHSDRPKLASSPSANAETSEKATHKNASVSPSQTLKNEPELAEPHLEKLPSNSKLDAKISKLTLGDDAELVSQMPKKGEQTPLTNSADLNVENLSQTSAQVEGVNEDSTAKPADNSSPSQERSSDSVPDLDSQPLPDSVSSSTSESPKADLEPTSVSSPETSLNHASEQSSKRTSSGPAATTLAVTAKSSEPGSKKHEETNKPAVQEPKKSAHTFENFYSGLVGSLIPGFDEIENQKFSYSNSQGKTGPEIEANTETAPEKEAKATEEAAEKLDKGKSIKEDESANETDALPNTSLTDTKKDQSPEASDLSRDKIDNAPKSSESDESTEKAADAPTAHTSTKSSPESGLITEPKAVQPASKDESNTVYLYMSLASGVRGSMSRFNKACTILKSYDIEYVPIEITLDERAKRLWKLKGVSKNKVLPAVFRDGDMKCDFNELVEANEIEDVEDLIFDGL